MSPPSIEAVDPGAAARRSPLPELTTELSLSPVVTALPMISSLPEEVLAPILAEAVAKLPDTFSYGRYDRHRLEWRMHVKLTTVCKAWRRLALAYPAYWASMQLTPMLRGLKEMLPRWKNHARRIYIDFEFPSTHGASESLEASNIYEGLTLLFANGATIAELEVCSNCERLFDALWRVTAPGWNSRMHTMVISTGSYDSDISIPLHTLVGAFSRLQHFTLEKCTVDWEAIERLGSQVEIAFSNLRTLRFLSVDPPPSSTVLNRILSSSQHLEELRIVHSFPPDFDATFRPQSQPSLLVDLHLEGSLSAVADTFLRLSANSTLDRLRAVELGARCPTSASNGFAAAAPLLKQLSHQFSALIRPKLQGKGLRESSLTISQQENWSSAKLVFGHRDPMRDISRGLGDLDYVLSIIGRIPPTDTPDHRSPVELLSVPEVGALSLDIKEGLFDEYPSEAWTSLFTEYAHLEALRLDGSTIKMDILIYLLSPRPMTNTHDSDSTVTTTTTTTTILLPKLRQLRIHYQTNFQPTGTFINSLEAMLKARWEGAVPVAVVEFSGCYAKEFNEGPFSLLKKRFPEDVTRFYNWGFVGGDEMDWDEGVDESEQNFLWDSS